MRGLLPSDWGRWSTRVVAALLAEWEALSELASLFETATETPTEPAAFLAGACRADGQRNRELSAQLATPVRLPGAGGILWLCETAVMDARQVMAAIRDAGFLIDTDDKTTAYRHDLCPVTHEFGE